MHRIQAVLFDFNGVIIDDEPVHDECWREVLAPVGLGYTDEEYYGPLLGVPNPVFLKLLLARRGKSVSPAQQRELLAAQSALYRERVRLRPVDPPGLGACLRDLAAHVPLGVVSGAWREEIEMHLLRLGLAACFRTILAAGEYRRPKPAPDPFLAGLEKLNQATGAGVRPENALVFEDSPNGVASARAAGMPVLGLAVHVAPERLPGCFAYRRDYAGLTYNLLQDLLNEGGT